MHEAAFFRSSAATALSKIALNAVSSADHQVRQYLTINFDFGRS